jgi:hypothetical protein
LKKSFAAQLILVGFAISFGGCTSTNNVYQSGENAPVTYQTFYDDLSPYGTWIDYPEYGHVWTPNVDEDFRPYDTNGNWVYSDLGWAWASDYSWGWAPFHYGRWLYDDMYGWLWVPGYNWAPAWVTWGSAGDDYCWAPLMPGVNVNQEFGAWRPPSFYWNACHRNNIYNRNLASVTERPEQVSSFATQISVINNFTPTRRRDGFYSKGPQVEEVQRYVQTKIQPATIRDVQNINEVKHNQNELNVYRPQVQDPKATTQQRRNRVAQPSEFRRADGANTRPFTNSGQRPAMQRSDQRANVNSLPVLHSGGTPSQDNNSRMNQGQRSR